MAKSYEVLVFELKVNAESGEYISYYHTKEHSKAMEYWKRVKDDFKSGCVEIEEKNGISLIASKGIISIEYGLIVTVKNDGNNPSIRLND